jgi:hypothetical protein
VDLVIDQSVADKSLGGVGDKVFRGDRGEKKRVAQWSLHPQKRFQSAAARESAECPLLDASCDELVAPPAFITL